MSVTKEQLAEMLYEPRYPRSLKYDPLWLVQNQQGPNVLWQMEWLCQEMDLQPGMRVLDLGAGTATSSIFLAKEFDVQVWATDLWLDPTQNLAKFRDYEVANRVFAIRADARALPYAEGFFDAIVCIGCYVYFGTDDQYLSYLLRFLRPEGRVGVVTHGLAKEYENGVPDYLIEKGWFPESLAFHTVEWWQAAWERTGLVNLRETDYMPDAWELWLRYERAVQAAVPNRWASDVPKLEADGGEYMTLVRLIADRR